MILYHDNTKKLEMDSMGALANNWNPDQDYGNEHVQVYFRIRADYYRYPYTGYEGYAEKKSLFEMEARSLFEEMGWEEEKPRMNGCCITMWKGKQDLYLHPQAFSGTVRKNDVKVIAEALAGAKTFQLEWVDLYHTVYEMSDEQYLAYLDARRPEIRYRIFSEAKMETARESINFTSLTERVLGQVRLYRLGEKGGYQWDGIAERFIRDEARTMEQEGYLINKDRNPKQSVHSVRSITERERKMRRLAAL